MRLVSRRDRNELSRPHVESTSRTNPSCIRASLWRATFKGAAKLRRLEQETGTVGEYRFAKDKSAETSTAQESKSDVAPL
jgi:hypothetical protein